MVVHPFLGTANGKDRTSWEIAGILGTQLEHFG